MVNFGSLGSYTSIFGNILTIVLLLTCGAVCYVSATSKGRCGWWWFFLGCAFNVLAILIIDSSEDLKQRENLLKEIEDLKSRLRKD